MLLDTMSDLNEATKRDSIFLEVADGENTFRIVPKFYGVKEHKAKVNGQFRFIVCPKATEEWYAKDEDRMVDQTIGCPICEKGTADERKINVQFLCIAANEKTGKVGVLKKGKTVFTPIFDAREKGFDLTKRSVFITREGKDLATEYKVTAAPNDSDYEVNAGTEIDLVKMTTPRSYSEIVDVLNGKDNFKK